MKKLLLGTCALALMVAGSASALAAEIDGVTDESGVSHQSSTVTVVTVSDTSTANITNDVGATANTGSNSLVSSDDQEGTRLVTGTATSAAAIENIANTNVITLEIESETTEEVAVSDVEDESAVSVDIDEVTNVELTTVNSAVVGNTIRAHSDTGANIISSGDDMDDVVAVTGDTGSFTGVSNMFNFTSIQIKRSVPGL